MRKQVKRNALGKERASSSRDGRKDRLGALQKRLYEVDGTWPELWDKIQTERQGIRTDVGK